MKIYKKDKHFRILKSLSVKLSDSTTFILTYMYYTDKMNKDNNQYRYEGIVVNNDEFEGQIRKMEAAPNLPWKWGFGIPNNFTMYYHNDTNREGARFLKARLDKALDSFDDFLKKANENVVKRYPLDGYCDESGNAIDIKNKEFLLKNVGKSIFHSRDRAERTYEIYDKSRPLKRYNSKVAENREKERRILEKRQKRSEELLKKHQKHEQQQQ